MFDEVAPAVPELYSIARTRPTPISVPEADPLVAVRVLYNWTVLYAAVSPLTKSISGVPNTLVINA